MPFDINREIIRVTREYCELRGIPDPFPKEPPSAPAPTWPDVPRFLRLKTAPRPWFTEDTRAEDERLDDPRHEPGSMPR